MGAFEKRSKRERTQRVLHQKTPSEVIFDHNKVSPPTKLKTNQRILPLVTQYEPNLKQIIMSKWHLIENQPLLREIFEEPPLISYKKDAL